MKTCVYCGAPLQRNKKYSEAQWQKAKFCNAVCAGKSKKGKSMPPVTVETRMKLSKALKGIPRTKEWVEKIRLSNLGKKHNITPEGRVAMSKTWIRGGWNKGKISSPEWREKVRLSRLGKTTSEKQKQSAKNRWHGESNPNWRGGIIKFSKKHYYDIRWKIWKKAVFERDNYTCQQCGEKGSYLQPHHIKGWTHYPELRYELANGLTLCVSCHKKTDNYGRKGIRKCVSKL